MKNLKIPFAELTCISSWRVSAKAGNRPKILQKTRLCQRGDILWQRSSRIPSATKYRNWFSEEFIKSCFLPGMIKYQNIYMKEVLKIQSGTIGQQQQGSIWSCDGGAVWGRDELCGQYPGLMRVKSRLAELAELRMCKNWIFPLKEVLSFSLPLQCLDQWRRVKLINDKTFSETIFQEATWPCYQAWCQLHSSFLLLPSQQTLQWQSLSQECCQEIGSRGLTQSTAWLARSVYNW